MTKILFRKEQLKSKEKRKSFDEIKSLYLKRVSHEGIYELHDLFEEQDKKITK